MLSCNIRSENNNTNITENKNKSKKFESDSSQRFHFKKQGTNQKKNNNKKLHYRYKLPHFFLVKLIPEHIIVISKPNYIIPRHFLTLLH